MPNITDISQENHQHGTVPTARIISLCNEGDRVQYPNRIKRETHYPADAATISCRLAFVKADSAAENINVKTRSTLIVSGNVALVPAAENLKSSQIGITRRIKTIIVMNPVVQVLIRSRS